MRMSNLVSVVVTAYNVAEYIEATINSIASQSYENLEILVVDDCSTDGTLEKIRTLQSLDDRVRVIENRQNEGGALAKRTGLRAATGKYFLICDGDDAIDPHTIEKCIKAVKVSNSDCAIFGYCFFETDLEQSFNPNVPMFVSSLPAIIRPNMPDFDPFRASKLSHISTVCFMRTDIHREPFCNAILDMPYFYDVPTFIQMFNSTSGVVLVNEALYYYRLGRRGQSIDGWFTEKRDLKLQCLIFAVDFLMKTDIAQTAKMRQLVVSKILQIAVSELPNMRIYGSKENYINSIRTFRKCLQYFNIRDAFPMRNSPEFEIYLILKYAPLFYVRKALKKIWISGILH